jgi:hypothetical protein
MAADTTLNAVHAGHHCRSSLALIINIESSNQITPWESYRGKLPGKITWGRLRGEDYQDYKRAFARKMPRTNLPFWNGKPMFAGFGASVPAKARRESVTSPSVGRIWQR